MPLSPPKPGSHSPKRWWLPVSGLLSLALGHGAPASELPAALRACPQFGDGFWAVPASTSCFRIEGSARSDAYAHDSNVTDAGFDGDPFVITGRPTRTDRLSFEASADISFDIRTRTEYGTLRTFLEVSTDADRDNRHSASTGRDRRAGAADRSTLELESAYVQLRGLTAGLTTSFFSFDHPIEYWGTHLGDFASEQILVGYTADLARGLSASLALESGELPDEEGLFDYVLFRGRGGSRAEDRRGQAPALVGQVRLERDWGSAQVAAAVARSETTIFRDARLLRPAGEEVTVGEAAMAGLSIKLPQLGEDSEFVLSGAYSRGLNFYTIGIGNIVWTSFNEVREPAVVTVLSGLTHAWTSQLQSNVGVSFSHVDFNLPGRRDKAGGLTLTANLMWSPATDLELGMELIHARVDARADAADLLDTTTRRQGASGVIFRVESKFGS